jgi:replication factor C large subunit
MTLPLIEKYRAKTFDEIKGQDTAIEEIKLFFKTFPRKKALILNGPTGTGKTSIVIALANEFDLEIFELNASDLRNRIGLESVLKPATNQNSLFKKGKIILMDEADGITTSDRGGLPELVALIEKSNFPILITANDIWQRKFSLLRQKCKMINLKELKESAIVEILNDVIKKENKYLKKDMINLIAKKSKGDVRSALNDLQSVINLGEEEFIHEISEREKPESVFDVLKKLFQTPTNKGTINIFDNLPMEINEIALWIEENIPSEYKGLALAKAYDYLSKADLFKGRIYRHQYWRFLVYQNFFLSAGISSATKLKSNKFIQYKRPSRILKIWLSNQRNLKKKSIIEKYAKFTHMSKNKANKEAFLLPFIIDKQAQEKLDLDEKEKIYLRDKKTVIIVENQLNKFKETI